MQSSFPGAWALHEAQPWRARHVEVDLPKLICQINRGSVWVPPASTVLPYRVRFTLSTQILGL